MLTPYTPSGARFVFSTTNYLRNAPFMLGTMKRSNFVVNVQCHQQTCLRTWHHCDVVSD